MAGTLGENSGKFCAESGQSKPVKKGSAVSTSITSHPYALCGFTPYRAISDSRVACHGKPIPSKYVNKPFVVMDRAHSKSEKLDLKVVVSSSQDGDRPNSGSFRECPLWVVDMAIYR